MKKAMYGLEKSVGIIILLIFLIIVFSFLFMPEGALNKVTKKIDTIKKFIPFMDSSDEKFDIAASDSFEASFDELASSFQSGKDIEKEKCLIHLSDIPSLGKWRFELLYVPSTKSTALSLINQNGQTLKTKYVENLKPCLINGDDKDSATFVTDSYIKSLIEKITKTHSELMNLDISENKILKIDSAQYPLVSVSGKKDNSQTVLLYKFDKDSICFISPIPNNADISAKLFKEILPAGKFPIELCYQSDSDFIKDCSDIKNKEKCFSYTKYQIYNNLPSKCNWDTDGIYECESCYDISTEKCKGYDNEESCSKDNCGFKTSPESCKGKKGLIYYSCE